MAKGVLVDLSIGKVEALDVVSFRLAGVTEQNIDEVLLPNQVFFRGSDKLRRLLLVINFKVSVIPRINVVHFGHLARFFLILPGVLRYTQLYGVIVFFYL